MGFISIEQFMGVMKEWCLFNGNDVVMKPNERLRCKVKCKATNCGWLCFVSKVRGSETYKLRTLIDKHNYVKYVKYVIGHLVSFDWVIEKIMENTINN